MSLPLGITAWNAVLAQLHTDLVEIGVSLLGRLPNAVVAIIVLFASVWFARIARRSVRHISRRAVRSASVRLLIERFATLAVWGIGALVAALLLFPGLRLGDIVAALGLGTVAIGFAFQDIFKNFLAGILLLFSEPFRIGDVIMVEEFEGVVEHIEMRSTRIRTMAGERVVLPNALVFTSPVRVRTAYADRRTEILVPVLRASDLGKVQATFLSAITGCDGVCVDPPARVEFTDFHESTVDACVRYWTLSTTDVVAVRSAVIAALDRSAEEAGLAVPHPVRTLHLQTADGLKGVTTP